jgi:hypothetical protein
MENFIKLELSNTRSGNKRYLEINQLFIESMVRYDSETEIATFGGKSYQVIETPDDIKKKMKIKKGYTFNKDN